MRPEKMRQIEQENRMAMLQEANREISATARQITRDVQRARAQRPPKMSEEEKRRKVLEIQAQILGSVTQRNGQAGAGVIPVPGTLPTAAKGVRAGAEAVIWRKKSRVLPRRPAPLKPRRAEISPQTCRDPDPLGDRQAEQLRGRR